MSLLNTLTPILNSKTAKATLEISANPKKEGELVLVVRPIVGPVANNATEELKRLCAALATPIKIIATPEVIEQELASAVAEQAGHRQSWANRAAQLEAMIAEGAQADAKKAATQSGGPGKATGQAAESARETAASPTPADTNEEDFEL